MISGPAWSAGTAQYACHCCLPGLQRSDMVPRRGSGEGGSATLTTVLSGSSMQVATMIALSAHHVRSRGGRSACHIGWVWFVTALTERNQGM
jgi:hypothetical protein